MRSAEEPVGRKKESAVDRREFITRAAAVLVGAPAILSLLQGCHGGTLPGGGGGDGGDGLDGLINRLNQVATQQQANNNPAWNDGEAITQQLNTTINDAWNLLANMSPQEVLDSASASMKPAMDNFINNHGLTLDYTTGSPKQFSLADLDGAAHNALSMAGADADFQEKFLIAFLVALLTGQTGSSAMDLVNEIAARDTQRTSAAAYQAMTGAAAAGVGTAGFTVRPFHYWYSALVAFIVFFFGAGLSTPLTSSLALLLGPAMGDMAGFHLCTVLPMLIILAAMFLTFLPSR